MLAVTERRRLGGWLGGVIAAVDVGICYRARMLKTKYLMVVGAVVMAILGLAATFAPQELARAAGVDASRGIAPLALQLTGALYLGFAMLDWMAKESVIGGIYNRPIAIGNLVHFVVAALALAKAVAAGQRSVAVLVLTAIYALLAIAFARIAFGASPTAAAARA